MTNSLKPFITLSFVLTTAIVLWTGAVTAEPARAETAPVPSRSGAKPDSMPTPDAAPKVDAAKRDPAKADATKMDATKMDAAKADAAKLGALPDDPMSAETQTNVRKYCVNIAAAATDARFTWQSKKLLELETKIKARSVELDAKQAELKRWYEKREAIKKEARESLVGIYAKMKPEAAAAQISALDDDMAVAVLAALSPGKAGAIFTEITPTDRAAKLAGLLANPSANPEKKL